MSKELKKLHSEAMDYADLAFLAKRQGEIDKSLEYFRLAFRKEKAASELVTADLSLEPTRSVLLRSAATLAFNCNELREAERLIAMALAGIPPEEIAEELRDLLDQINFGRHLKLKGIELSREEFQMSLAGKAVGPGYIASDLFTNRVTNISTNIIRIAERIKGKPFREKGRAEKSLVEKLPLYLSAPRAASFAITFRLGAWTQASLIDENLVETVVAEFMECTDLFNRGDVTRLKEKIPDDSYYRNFVSLTRNVLPDGRDINFVGFTASVGAIKKVSLTSTTTEEMLTDIQALVISKAEKIEITGYLKYADSSSEEKNIIKLKDDKLKLHKIIVPDGLMADIVRPMWEEKVTVSGVKEGKLIRLQNIIKAE